jgi:molybdopterin-guanine dinucleotide biosynthesis adapter protein
VPPIVCIVGRPKSGKTTLITKLIPELKRRGYKVATIKHVSHEFKLDTPGKDSWQHSQAGSECAILSSPHQVAIFQNVDHDLSPDELAQLIPGDFDIILAEGFKRSKELKIEVHRRKVGELVCSPKELMAVATDERLPLDVPQFSLDDVAGIVDIIIEGVGARCIVPLHEDETN